MSSYQKWQRDARLLCLGFSGSRWSTSPQAAGCGQQGEFCLVECVGVADNICRPDETEDRR